MTFAQASSAPFLQAIVATVSEQLGVPASAVTGVSVVGRRRMLLSSVTIAYTVNVTSGVTPDALMTMLQTSVSSGSFLESLSINSGISIAGLSNLVLTNSSPTLGISASSVAKVGKAGKGAFDGYFCDRE